jgi:AcrR family transcriptional regulator
MSQSPIPTPSSGSPFRVKRAAPRDVSVDSRRGRRLSPSDREKCIAAAAVTFFSTHGFDGQTRELAAALGITQPLLYRYFPSKEALIERVFQDVFVGRWDPFWEELIIDRKMDLEARLTQFYVSYASVILTPEWVRLFTLAGLKGLDFNGRYLQMLHKRIFEIIVGELRYEFGRPSLITAPSSDLEIEMIWSLHASIFYLGVRRFIYGMPLASPVDKIISAKVKAFLYGVSQILPPTEQNSACA